MNSLEWTPWVWDWDCIHRQREQKVLDAVFLDLKKVLSWYWFILSFNCSCDIFSRRHLACTVQQSSFLAAWTVHAARGQWADDVGGLDLSSHNILYRQWGSSESLALWCLVVSPRPGGAALAVSTSGHSLFLATICSCRFSSSPRGPQFHTNWNGDTPSWERMTPMIMKG